ncbi:MAG: DegV family protein [Nitrososphaerales archaeon]
MIRIITDSTCEAPAEVLHHPAVTVVPLSVVFGQEALRDGIDITRDQFWTRLPDSNPLPTTSQAAPSDFLGLYQSFTEAGDEVIVLPISGKLSGTLSSAVIAYESNPGWAVDVVDSKSVSIGLGLLVQEAVKMIEAGATRTEIVARLLTLREKVQIVFVVETLEYLQKGGRIGKAQAFVGTLLRFKPLLGIADGEVVPLARVRSRAKALQAAQELLLKGTAGRGGEVRMALTHALAPEEAWSLGAKLSKAFQTADYYVSDLGPVIGVHVGPGTVGAAVVTLD